MCDMILVGLKCMSASMVDYGRKCKKGILGMQGHANSCHLL